MGAPGPPPRGVAPSSAGAIIARRKTRLRSKTSAERARGGNKKEVIKKAVVCAWSVWWRRADVGPSLRPVAACRRLSRVDNARRLTGPLTIQLRA
ncbi:unnamed protein product, partial [Iphiclides podalirius]